MAFASLREIPVLEVVDLFRYEYVGADGFGRLQRKIAGIKHSTFATLATPGLICYALHRSRR